MKYMIVAALTAACAIFLATPLAAAQKTTEQIGAENAASQAAKEAKEEETVQKSFAGFQLGVGLSLTIDSGSEDRITNAQVVNGIVRVDNEDNAIARIMLETHYFFTPSGCLFALKTANEACALLSENEWGWGPFVAIQPGEGEIVDAIGLGLMLGFRREGREDSFNLGLGYVVDPNSRVLGDGITVNQPLPLGETEIRFKEKEQWGWVIITSYTF
jgi:hypothetical protein